MKKASVIASVIAVVMLSNQLAFSQRGNSGNTPPPPPTNGAPCAVAELGAAKRYLQSEDAQRFARDMQAINNVVQGRLGMNDRQFEGFMDSFSRIFRNSLDSISFFASDPVNILIYGMIAYLGSHFPVLDAVLFAFTGALLVLMAIEAEASFVEELSLWGGISADEALVLASVVRSLAAQDPIVGGNIDNLRDYKKFLKERIAAMACAAYIILNRYFEGRLIEEWKRRLQLLGEFYGPRSFPPTYYPRDPIDPNPIDPNVARECTDGRVRKWVCTDEWIQTGEKSGELVLVCRWKCVLDR